MKAPSATPAWTLDGGFTAVSHRFADTENTAGVPDIRYTGIPENHALPAAGRTLIGTASYRF
jgi:hypothetical protein